MASHVNVDHDLEFGSTASRYQAEGYTGKRHIGIIKLCQTTCSWLGSVIMPSFLQEKFKSTLRPRENGLAFLDGLRGAVAFTVYMDHFLTPIFPHLRYANSRSDDDSFWKLPFVRLIYSGDATVATFFVISGIVLSKKAVDLATSDSTDKATSILAASTFKRGFRLFIPPTVSTFIVMVFCQAGFFDDALLSSIGAPHPLRFDTLAQQIVDWLRFIFTFLFNPWTWYPNPTTSNYGNHLWTVSVEMACSMQLFLVLGCLVHMRVRTRLIIATGLIVFNFAIQRLPLALFYFGMLLAFTLPASSLPASSLPYDDKHPRLRNWCLRALGKLVVFLLLVIGCYLMSYSPVENGSIKTFPNATMVWSLGGAAVVGSALHQPLVQKILNWSVPQYLGKISFSFYILHEPILQIAGWKSLMAVKDAPSLVGQPEIVQVFVISVVWIIITLFTILVSDIFWRLIDLPSIQLADWLRRRVWRPEELQR